jgi:pyridoxine 5-phosphate synthase
VRDALRLGLNIDHVATLRNARGGTRPDPVEAAHLGILAGVDGITAHLREDRRHIRDVDIVRLKATLTKPLNLEMAATAEMTEIALATRPHAACLVPERREERTTEGGLDVIGRADELAPVVARLSDAGIRVSLFIEPTPAAVEAAARLGAPVVELHTGAWCHFVETGSDEALAAFDRIRTAAARAMELGITCHAGHGLDLESARAIATVPEVRELNIGHFIIGDALTVGLPEAVRRMRQAMDEGRAEMMR